MVQPANKRLVTEAALPEAVRAVIEASFVAGTGITITHDGGANTITIAATGTGGLDLETIQDAVAAMIVEGSGLSAVYDDALGTYTLTNTVTDTNTTDPEVVRDTMAAALVAGTGISVTHDDTANTITIAYTGGGGGGLDLEGVQDAVATMFLEGTGLTAVYDDTNGTYTLSLDSAVLAETIRDTMATALVAGAGISVAPNDAGDTITITLGAHNHLSSQVTDLTETVQDLVAAMILEGSGLSATYDDTAGTYTITNTVTDTNTTDPEVVRDTMAAALVAGTGVTITPDDTANTITIAATGGGGGLDLEAVQDAVAAMVLAGTGLTATYDDTAGTYTISTTGLATTAQHNQEVLDRVNWDNFLSRQAFLTSRLDRECEASIRRTAQQAQQNHQRNGNKYFDWSTTTAGGAVTGAGAAVAGNKLGANTATLPAGQAILPIGLSATERAHISFTFTWRPGGTSTALYMGVDNGALGHAPSASSADAILMGINSGNAHSPGLLGTTVDDPFVAAGNAPAQVNIPSAGGGPTVETVYQANIDVGDKYISMSYRAVGSQTDLHTMLIDRATFQTGGKTLNNILLSVYDSRGPATGHNYGPVTISRSLQPSRKRVVADQTIEGAEHFHRVLGPRTSATDAERWRVSLPKNYDPRRPSPVVFFYHQTVTGSDKTAWDDFRMQPVTKALNDAGYIVVGILDGGLDDDRFGNQASIDNHHAAEKSIRETYNVGPWFALTASGGALPLLNGIARGTFRTPTAVALIGPGIDLEAIFNGPDAATFQPRIRDAYGIAADNSDYAAKTAGYDPMDHFGASFRGVPFRIYTTATDPVVPRETHVDPFVTKIAPYSPEASVFVGSGGHLHISQYPPSDIVDFFNKYLGLVPDTSVLPDPSVPHHWHLSAVAVLPTTGGPTGLGVQQGDYVHRDTA